MPRSKRTDPDRYADPLGLDDPLPEGKPGYAPSAALVVTGLSDEEDAARHLALRFNPAVKFCPNCETYVDQDKADPVNRDLHVHWCPYCGDNLREVGVAPRKRKFDAR